ncbi:hypothetical protein DEVEQU_00212 [Devosia equisanguinis]|uniref:DUF305 domain-containing protein n=1 Tax=Devosia equisanguinis TaxID=2490941 RepID=A0A447I6Q2_9HYPH|nr:DUF305 domain-containing protein [Devosia equisanguinis]VDS03092.1 hypothetical protein DEVEQU_00212 [Devosia equisanguinis]
MKNSLIVLAIFGMSSLPAVAQDAHAGHDMSGMGANLPKICVAEDGMSGDMSMGMDHEMDQAHMDLMAGMEETNKRMMDAMMVEDIDVAFVCGMIPHHQAAINMAKAELQHGDNDWAKAMAQKIIDAQEAEIAEMVTWLEGEGSNE